MGEARLARFLPWLFVVVALPIGLALALLTPPFQNPDEAGHFLRATQIAGGELVGRRLDGGTTSGGRVDGAAYDTLRLFAPLAGHPERRVDPGATAQAAAVRWGAPARDVGFPNTVLWSPVLYFPVAAAVRVGQALDLTVLATLRLCRLVNLAIAIAIVAVALHLWPGRAVLFTSLTMPMALAMFGSVAHDGLMIAGAALALALIRRGGAFAVVAGALLLGLIAAGRPTYAPLVLLPLLGRSGVGARIAGVALGVVCVAAWAPFAAGARIEFGHDDVQPDSAAQLAYLLGHLLAIPTIALDTLRVHAVEYAVMFVGALGALDTLMPKPYYVAGFAVLLAALIADLTGPDTASPPARGLLLLVLLSATALIFVSQYLIWTAVGATVIEGVQGRYFLPLVPAAALLIGGLARAPRPRTAALWVVAIFPLATAAVAPLAVWTRYYG